MNKIKRFTFRIFRFYFRKFYYNNEGMPIKCEYCDNNTMKYYVFDTIYGVASEEEIICKECLSTIGWKSYGNYDQDYSRLVFSPLFY